jgi:NTP pyrophosphatase (non-canonical NTP hydrolase)
MTEIDRLQKLQNSILEWSCKTFANGKFDRSRDLPLAYHLVKEAEEVKNAIQAKRKAIEPTNDYVIEELADTLILLLDIASHNDCKIEQLIEQAERKLAVNITRRWGQPDANGVIEHRKDYKEVDLLGKMPMETQVKIGGVFWDRANFCHNGRNLFTYAEIKDLIPAGKRLPTVNDYMVLKQSTTTVVGDAYCVFTTDYSNNDATTLYMPLHGYVKGGGEALVLTNVDITANLPWLNDKYPNILRHISEAPICGMYMTGTELPAAYKELNDPVIRVMYASNLQPYNAELVCLAGKETYMSVRLVSDFRTD